MDTPDVATQHEIEHQTVRSPDPILYLKLVLMAVFWGGTFVAGRIVSREAGPFSAAFLRFVVASFFLLIFLLRTERKSWKDLFNGGNLLYLPLLGLTGVFLYNVMFFSGLKTVPAGRASLIVAANPAFIALFSVLIFKENIGPLRVLGILTSISGAAVVIAHGNPATLLEGKLGLGELFILGCVASWVSYSLLGKAALKTTSPLVAVTSACVIGMVCLLPPALNEGITSDIGHFSFAVWMGIFFLGFFGSALGFIWYYDGVLLIGPSRAGVFINLVPISSVIMAFFLLNESIDTSILVGAAMVVTGVFLTNRT